MHENQVAYPNRHATVEEAKRDHHFAITNLTSMLASDCVIFNSAWNRDSFLTGIGAVLSHQPDQITHEWIESIGAKSVIAWPPVDLEPVDREATVLHNTPTVVWPCRWEHDKGPERLLEIARQYSDAWDLRWIILGGQSSSIPPEMALFLDEQGDRILHAGFVEDRAAYLQWLSRGDWVLSTAHHEFFGLAVAEALLMGCLPWLPDTLSYPELLPESAKGLSPGEPPDDPKAIRRACVDHLRPALAVNAVSKIEQIIAAVIQKGPPSPFWEPCHHGTAGS
jgi:glycosyltransferase involved in cell wall biosynthesis